MPVKCNDAFLKDFVSLEDIQGLLPKLQIAHKKIVDMTGEGSEFLGWYNLPDNYDKNEFERIKQAAKKIQNSCDVFVVIGIGGSYLGARSAIEFIKSNNYNLLCKNTPQIFFVGNSISPSALSEVLLLCEGKDVCANIDNLNFLSGQQLDTVNKKAYLATLIAHSDGNVPNIVLEVDSRKEYDYGYLVYFFELACAVSGYILGVNPFDQPGVEEYKKNMFALLGKPGKENQTRRKELEDKLNLSK